MTLFGKKKITLIEGQTEGAKSPTENPGRGMLRVFQFRIEEEFDEAYTDTVISDNESMVLLVISLAHYKDEDLPTDAINHFHHILSYFKRKEKDIIIRVCYDLKGEAMISEPSTIDRVEAHMDQITKVLAGYSQYIFLWQGLMVGSWGEMHSSRYTTEVYLKRLYRHFRKSEIGSTYMAVRTPIQIRMLLGENKALMEENPSLTNLDKITLFDDAILSDDTDMGTFSQGEKEKDLEFLQETCYKVPTGGETVYGEEIYTAEEVVDTLKKMRLNYLNSCHDKRKLDSWKSMPYGDGTLYDYVESHLGYRILLREVVWNKKEEQIEITIVNTGFGGLIETAECKALIKRKQRKEADPDSLAAIPKDQSFEYETEQRLDYRVHHATWEPGQTMTLIMPLQELPKGTYIMSVELYRKKDGKRIYFVNENPEQLENIVMIQ